MFHSGDQLQILLLTTKLHSMRMKEGGDVEEYLRHAKKLHNKLAAIGERIPEQMIVNIVMNGLPQTFKGLIMSINTLIPLPSFVQVVGKVINEHHRL